MSRFGYVKWNARDDWADLVLSDEFYSWHPVAQLDALLDIKADLETEIEEAHERCYGSLKRKQENNK
jgi:hypothetical protein